MTIRTVVAAVSLALLPLLAVPARAGVEAPRVRAEGAIAYLSGGISEEGQRETLELGKPFNLQVVFTLASGEYLADVRVSIADAKGARVLDTVAEGPFLFVKLPPGTYRISASLNEQAIARTIAVGPRGQQVVHLRWKSELPPGADGSRAS
jgi:hypothetical protein